MSKKIPLSSMTLPEIRINTAKSRFTHRSVIFSETMHKLTGLCVSPKGRVKDYTQVNNFYVEHTLMGD